MAWLVDMAPSLDSFTIRFFQACWEAIKGELMRVFHEFHVNDRFEKSLNATFLALIPKKMGSTDVKECHHISLVNGVYKTLSLKCWQIDCVK